jgi:hypothetical protein
MANPTSNYGFVLPTSSDLVTDLPADFDVALQGVDTRLKALNPATTLGDLNYASATANTNTRLGIGTNGQVLGVVAGVPAWTTDASGMTNPMTTTGDMIYSTPNSTPVRRGIGTTGQILTVSGGIPVWATPSGSTLAISSIASGSVTSGSSLSITSLSSYDFVEFIIGGYEDTSTTDVSITINSNTGTNYSRTSLQQSASTSDSQYSSITGTFDTSYKLTTMGQKGGATDGVLRVRFTNCKAVGFTNIEAFHFYGGPSNTPKRLDWSLGSYNVAEAVSSFQLNLSAGTFTGGNYRVLAG